MGLKEITDALIYTLTSAASLAAIKNWDLGMPTAFVHPTCGWVEWADVPGKITFSEHVDHFHVFIVTKRGKPKDAENFVMEYIEKVQAVIEADPQITDSEASPTVDGSQCIERAKGRIYEKSSCFIGARLTVKTTKRR